ncbi:hypothetical protein Hamer_G026689 [Homarus americanus]|uniref:Uncharacterized protein n=1 Tax=Homarus americanus TaxID=6706 RepID=A0A8J5N025_HOMAM|nr:hypothetical protein Hamer_G026689 [Homarus americanus]
MGGCGWEEEDVWEEEGVGVPYNSKRLAVCVSNR